VEKAFRGIEKIQYSRRVAPCPRVSTGPPSIIQSARESESIDDAIFFGGRSALDRGSTGNHCGNVDIQPNVTKCRPRLQDWPTCSTSAHPGPSWSNLGEAKLHPPIAPWLKTLWRGRRLPLPTVIPLTASSFGTDCNESSSIAVDGRQRRIRLWGTHNVYNPRFPDENAFAKTRRHAFHHTHPPTIPPPDRYLLSAARRPESWARTWHEDRYGENSDAFPCTSNPPAKRSDGTSSGAPRLRQPKPPTSATIKNHRRRSNTTAHSSVISNEITPTRIQMIICTNCDIAFRPSLDPPAWASLLSNGFFSRRWGWRALVGDAVPGLRSENPAVMAERFMNCIFELAFGVSIALRLARAGCWQQTLPDWTTKGLRALSPSLWQNRRYKPTDTTRDPPQCFCEWRFIPVAPR